MSRICTYCKRIIEDHELVCKCGAEPPPYNVQNLPNGFLRETFASHLGFKDALACRVVYSEFKAAVDHPYVANKISRFPHHEPLILRGHALAVQALAFLSNDYLVSGSGDKRLCLWNKGTGKCIRTVTHNAQVHCLTTLPNGLLVSGDGDGIKVWDMHNGNRISALMVHGGVRHLAVLSNGLLASTGEDEIIRIWDVEKESCVDTLREHTNVACFVALPNGLLASGTGFDSYAIRVWDMHKRSCVNTLMRQDVLCLAALPDGSLVSGHGDGTIKVWDMRNKCYTLEGRIEGHTGIALCLALLPDGSLVSGHGEGTIKVWDMHSKTCIKTLSGHISAVRCLAVSPDGSLASGSDLHTVRLWNRVSLHDLLASKAEHDRLHPKKGFQRVYKNN